MPLYEYRCETCEHLTEALRPMASANTPCDCPACGSPAQRVTSVFTPSASYARPTEMACAPTPCARPGGCGCHS